MNAITRTFPPFLKLLICFFLAAQLPAQSSLEILPEENPETPETHQLLWETKPGVRYEAQTSTNLSQWDPVDGYPAEATSVVDALSFGVAADPMFFRVLQIDEQAPEILERSPDDEAFAVRRFSTIAVALTDLTGVDPTSISLEVGSLGTFTVADPELSFANGVLYFDTGGDTALGGYGATVSASLSVGDALGNTATYDWSFDLEREAQVEENLFVFGSPAAQRAGQQIGAIPTRILAQMYEPGPIRMNANTDPWSVSSVDASSITISYTGASAPVFEMGTYLANMTPATIEEIFYRKVTGLVDDTQSKLLILQTEEVSLLEIVSEGSTTSVGAASPNVAFVANAEGVIERAVYFDENVAMEAIEISYDGLGIGLREDGFRATRGALDLDVGSKPIVLSLTASELNFAFRPSIRAMLEITLLDGLKRYETVFRGDIETAIVVDFEATGTLPLGEKTIFDLPFANIVVPLPPIGVVPVAVVVTPGARLKAEAEVRAIAGIETGIRQDATAEVGIRYNSEWEEPFEYVRTFDFAPTEVVGPEIELVGEFGAGLTLEPYLYTLLYGAAGASVAFPAKGEMIIAVDALEPESGPQGRFEASVGLVLAPALHAKAEEWLNWDPPFSLGVELWKDQWHLFPELEQLAFTLQPESLSVSEGSNVRLTSAVNRSSGVTFRWYKDGTPLPQTQKYLNLLNVNRFHSGDYSVRVKEDGGASITSESATLTVVKPGAAPLEGFAYIPAGSFSMGDSFSEEEINERPVHTVSVSGFYMGRTEVAYAQWQEVYNWAVANGYSFDNAGSGKGASHPVHSVSWYDVVKWCNAASERAGATPVYRTSGGEVYRTGRITPVIDYVNGGYRLPTEAEWEKAARGGASGRRFPWGSTIGHSHANYAADGSYPYDSSPFPDSRYHPSYDSGDRPYTSPVGSFAANGYGLYDMAGNVWEWCNDWFGSSYYNSSPGSDPRGPSSGSIRVLRGGCWYYSAHACRVAYRGKNSPVNHYDNFGFRLARSSGN